MLGPGVQQPPALTHCFPNNVQDSLLRRTVIEHFCTSTSPNKPATLPCQAATPPSPTPRHRPSLLTLCASLLTCACVLRCAAGLRPGTAACVQLAMPPSNPEPLTPCASPPPGTARGGAGRWAAAREGRPERGHSAGTPAGAGWGAAGRPWQDIRYCNRPAPLRCSRQST